MQLLGIDPFCALNEPVQFAANAKTLVLAMREEGRAPMEQSDETGFSGGVKRRHLSRRVATCCPGFGETKVHIIYTPNFGIDDCRILLEEGARSL